MPLFRRLLASFLVALLVLPPAPALAFLGLGEFGIKDEKELGEKFNLLVRANLPLVEDPEVTQYVSDMVDRLRAAMPPQPFEITKGVVASPALNAFAAPAGYVFVFSGLLLNMETESEVAGVMAHELAHVSQRHVAKRIETMGATSLLTLAGMLAGAFLGGKHAGGIVVGAAAAQQTALLAYSRENEQEADEIGLGYLIKAGYPPQGLHKAFEKLRKKQWLGGGGEIPTYLSSHPALDERIGYIEQNIQRLPRDVQQRKDDNARLLRVQTLLRARLMDPAPAVAYFTRQDSKTPCLDHLGRGIALSRLNKFKDAEAAMGQALACAPGDPLFLRELGRLKFLQGDFAAAQPLLESAARTNPRDLMALFFLGRIQGEAGRIEPAMDTFRRILREIPEDPEVHEAYGRVLGPAGRIFLAHLHLAWAAFYRQDEKKTIFHLEKAEALARSEPEKKDLAELKERIAQRKELLKPTLF